MTNRRHGHGSITKERGKYRVRVPDGTGRKVSIGVYRTSELAERMRAASLLERAEVTVGVTLRQWGEVWLHKIRDQKGVKGVRSTWQSIVLGAPFVDVPLATLTRVEVSEWAEGLPKKRQKRSILRNGLRSTIELDEPISRKTAANALNYLKLCVAAAIRAGHLSENVVDVAQIPKERNKIEEPITYLEEEEVEMLLGYPELPLEQRVVFTLATHQALREGELAGMEWQRVDWKDRGWWVAKSWDGSTKTGKTRWQALLPRAEAALREWWMHRGQPSTGVVFPSARRPVDGKPQRYARGHDWGWAHHPGVRGGRGADRQVALTRLGWWHRAGIRKQVRFHDLRDTAATHLLSGTWGRSWRIEDVSRHLGHSSIKVTEARYAHTTKEALQRAASATESAAQMGRKRAALFFRERRKYSKSLAPEEGLEPTTNRLTADRSTTELLRNGGERYRGVGGSQGRGTGGAGTSGRRSMMW
jgi:integrase